MATELLERSRAATFVTFALEHDLQVQINRRQAQSYLVRSFANEGDEEESVIAWDAESFDKMMTFLSQNDAQVHYSASNTVGVYAIVRLLGTLRRALRDSESPVYNAHGSPLMSPTRRRPGAELPLSARGLSRALFAAGETGQTSTPAKAEEAKAPSQPKPAA